MVESGDGEADAAPLKAEAELALRHGHVSRAEELYRNLLFYERDLHGEVWPGQLSILNILARLLLLRQEFGEAVLWLEKALVITATVFGGRASETASAMVTLAGALRKSGTASNDNDQQLEAEQLFLQAIEIYTQVHQDGHAETASAMLGLAMCSEAQGKLGEARTLYEDALTMRRRVLGQGHADTADALLCLASLLSRTWETAVAMVRYEQAITLFRALYPNNPDHPRIRLVRESLQTLFTRQAKELWDQGLYGEACVSSTAAERGCVGNAIVQGYFYRKEPGVLMGSSLRKVYVAVFPCMEGGGGSIAGSSSSSVNSNGVDYNDSGSSGSSRDADLAAGGGDPLMLLWAYDADLSAQGRALPGMTVATSLWRAMKPAHSRTERQAGEIFGQGNAVLLGAPGTARTEIKSRLPLRASSDEANMVVFSILPSDGGSASGGSELFSALCEDESSLSAWNEAVATGRAIVE